MTDLVLEDEEDLAMQEAIRSRANMSLAVLEKTFIRNGSGRYLVLRSRDIELPQHTGAEHMVLEEMDS